MFNDQINVDGVVVAGFQVASGKSPSSPYPAGSIEMQVPFFYERGVDLRHFFMGTLNVSIAPWQFGLVRPRHTLRQIAWTDLIPPEDFSFSPCDLLFEHERYSALIYYPHPDTKPQHHQPANTLEILAPKIDGIHYGSSVELVLNSAEIRLHQQSNE